MVNKIYLTIRDGARVTIGEKFTTISGGALNPLISNSYCSIYVSANAVLEIGDHVGMSGARIWASERITIGDHVHIGANCIIVDGDLHSDDWRLRRVDAVKKVPYKTKPVAIGDDVWLGANVIVLKGVTIGERSIVGAGSVVTHDIPSDCIAAGNPCKEIRKINAKSENFHSDGNVQLPGCD